MTDSGGYYLFIADLHLSVDQPEKWQYLVRWLDSLRPPVKGLYILGDFFKYWIGDDQQNEMIDQLKVALKRVSRLMSVVLLRGNRDFLLGSRFARESGVQILNDGCVVDLYGRATMLMHGDALCKREWRYLCFKAAATNPLLQWLFTRLPIGVRDRIARWLHHRSQERHKKRKKDAKIWLNYEWLAGELQSKEASQVIYGHFHRTVLRDFDRYREIGLPSWDQGPSWLRYYPDHTVSFIELSEFDVRTEA